MLSDRNPIALPPIYLIGYDDLEGVDCDQSPADVAIFQIPFNCSWHASQCVISEVCAGSTSTPVVKFDHRPTAEDDTGRSDGDVGAFDFGTAAKSTVFEARPTAAKELKAGDQVVVQLVTAAVGTPTGHFRPVLLVQYDPEVQGNMAGITQAVAP